MLLERESYTKNGKLPWKTKALQRSWEAKRASNYIHAIGEVLQQKNWMFAFKRKKKKIVL